ncbi:hypothetical protein [Bradyrhizobium sp. Ai1a-2]|nr:hypothetical protein [Bradyrhizobium sp. Ai1a-2]
MRRSTVHRFVATKAYLQAGNPNDASAQIICAALVLAVVTLAWRIAAVW